MAHYLVPKKALLVLPIIIVVLYNDWLLNFWLSPRLNQIIATVSEASAVGQPYNWLYRVLDTLFGLLILATIPLLMDLKKIYKDSWLLILGYVFAGIDSIVDAWLQISCAPSLVKGCSFSNHASFSTSAHMIESLVAGTIIFVVPCVWWYLNRRSERSLLNQVSLGFVLVQIICGFSVVIEKLMKIDSYGVIHRLYLLSIAVWLATILYSSLLIRIHNNTT